MRLNCIFTCLVKAKIILILIHITCYDVPCHCIGYIIITVACYKFVFQQCFCMTNIMIFKIRVC